MNEYDRYPFTRHFFASIRRAGQTDRTRCTVSDRLCRPRVLCFNTERPISTVDSALQRSNATTRHVASQIGRVGEHTTHVRDDMTGRAPRNDRT
jgi:hypothetical protein